MGIFDKIFKKDDSFEKIIKERTDELESMEPLKSYDGNEINNGELVSSTGIEIKIGFDYILNIKGEIERINSKTKFSEVICSTGIIKEPDFDYLITDNGNIVRKFIGFDKIKSEIITLLKQKNEKMFTSDIDAFLKYQNVDKIKELCENMYHNGDISRTSNYRYFILSKDKVKSKNLKLDATEEIRKYAKLYDDGILTEEEFQIKKKELLGL